MIISNYNIVINATEVKKDGDSYLAFDFRITNSKGVAVEGGGGYSSRIAAGKAACRRLTERLTK